MRRNKKIILEDFDTFYEIDFNDAEELLINNVKVRRFIFTNFNICQIFIQNSWYYVCKRFKYGVDKVDFILVNNPKLLKDFYLLQEKNLHYIEYLLNIINHPLDHHFSSVKFKTDPDFLEFDNFIDLKKNI